MVRFPGLRAAAAALLLSALAIGHTRAEAARCPLPGTQERPADSRCAGDARPAAPPQEQPREQKRPRGRYAPPVQMEQPPPLKSAPALPRPAPVPPPARPEPVTPAPITSCDAGGCWDASGRRYNGSGSTMIRGDGKVCQQIGNVMQCN
ncbi:MAG TPA: hypothetical protein VJ576_17485 [Rhodocyclaceae bacterium]|nr:hypothetical protein [Rhodocyclaceae bacterium]